MGDSHGARTDAGAPTDTGQQPRDARPRPGGVSDQPPGQGHAPEHRDTAANNWNEAASQRDYYRPGVSDRLSQSKPSEADRSPRERPSVRADEQKSYADQDKVYRAGISDQQPQSKPGERQEEGEKRGDLTKSFSWKEFRCNDGTDVPDKYRDNTRKLAKNLQVLRDHIDRKITVLSGYRTPEYNRSEKVKGAKRSQHLYGRAADIQAEGMTARQLHSTIKELIKQKKMEPGGLGLYSNFVHYDVRGKEVHWQGK